MDGWKRCSIRCWCCGPCRSAAPPAQRWRWRWDAWRARRDVAKRFGRHLPRRDWHRARGLWAGLAPGPRRRAPAPRTGGGGWGSRTWLGCRRRPGSGSGCRPGTVGRELKLTAFRKTTIDQDESSQLLRRGRRTIPASIGGSCMSHDSGPLARVVDDIAFAAHTHRVQRRRHALSQPPGRHGAHPGRRSRHRRPDVF